MQVEIWSDIMCPFCYIGKRRFEKALASLENGAAVKVTWKSFQLNPDLETQPGLRVNDYLAAVKGWTPEQAAQVNRQVTAMAAEDGLEYHLENAVVANSRDAHRLIQFAKSRDKGDAMEEVLFHAYFTEGLNTADHAVLTGLAVRAGLDAGEAATVLADGSYGEAVDQDIYEARQIGVRGVPYFVLNDRYAVSGAQPVEHFQAALRQALAEWQQAQPQVITPSNPSGSGICEVDGNCS